MTIKEQNNFCMDLMRRLSKDVAEIADDKWHEKYTRAQDDIKRLRRELMILSKMLGGHSDAHN